MKRVAIAAVGLAVAAALAFGAGAFALYVWPGHEQAPSSSPRYTWLEAIGVVRATLAHEATCVVPGVSEHKARWGAIGPHRGAWWVAAFCGEGEGPPGGLHTNRRGGMELL
jgi:hypothetical protein